MGDLVLGDDGLPAEEVGPWVKEKHELLCRYIDISRGVRAKFIGPGKGGATYIDLFSGPGRAKIKDTEEYVDGSCVAAWKKSVEGGSPFSAVYLADRDDTRLAAAKARLEKLNAPVVAIPGDAIDTVQQISHMLSGYSLHFAFLDPFSLGVLDFSIIERLSRFKRMDVLIHLSKMDLQRNLAINISTAESALDSFCPGWRGTIDISQAQLGIRAELVEYWRSLVSGIGIDPSKEMKLIKGSKQQHLYWLLLLASHDLAHKFWKIATEDDQSGFGF